MEVISNELVFGLGSRLWNGSSSCSDSSSLFLSSGRENRIGWFGAVATDPLGGLSIVSEDIEELGFAKLIDHVVLFSRGQEGLLAELVKGWIFEVLKLFVDVECTLHSADEVFIIYRLS